MYAILFERKVGHYMAYIREKWKKGKPYYYIVESQRDGTKVRQRILEYIGTVDNLKEYALKATKVSRPLRNLRPMARKLSMPKRS